jgi:uncharacterized coiled-coil protein SlyX
MKANRPVLIASALLVLGSAAACATSPFDRHFDARRYAEAAQAFEQDPALQDNERTLYRAGLVHALPDSPVYQPEVARNLLTRLLDVFPRSSHADEARSLLALLTELERSDREAERRQYELERQVSDLETDLQRVKHQVSWLEQRFETQESHITALSRMVTDRHAELRDKDAEIRSLRAELERLQEIDLGPRGGGGRTPPPDSTVADSAGAPGDRSR